MASQAVLDARARRASRAQNSIQQTEWFINEVCDKVAISLQHRVKIATELVRSKMTLNISRPVTKLKGPDGRIRVTDRSKPGEYPKADTTLLLKTLFSVVQQVGLDSWAGFIGTPLDYGVILELRMNRSFLVRTLLEEQDKVVRILSGPIT